jgi:hypothetical protein
VLTNGTLFTDRLIERIRPLASAGFALQISLDSADPEPNDVFRGERNFAKVVAAIPRLRDVGIRVRLATTSTGLEPDALARLCDLHRALGVPDEDHVVRNIVRRGRARSEGIGVDVSTSDLTAELTITAEGAFWSPFGPTVQDGRLDTDLLLTRVTNPLTIPAAALLRVAGGAGPSTTRGEPKIC